MIYGYDKWCIVCCSNATVWVKRRIWCICVDGIRIRSIGKYVNLGLAVIVVTGIPFIFADKFIGGGNGGAGLAAASSAGAAVANPAIIAKMAPQFAPVAVQATALVATSVVVTSILVPILTSIWYNRFNKVKAIQEAQL